MQYSPVTDRIVLIKLDSLGDVVRTTACLGSIKEKFPGSHITWVTRRNSIPLLALNPKVDRTLAIESNYLELLLAEEFELSLCPDADLLGASINRLVRASRKLGFVADGRGGILPLNDAAEHWWRMGIDDSLKRANRRTYGEWLYDIFELPGPVLRPFLQPRDAAQERIKYQLAHASPLTERWICFNTGASDRWEEKKWKLKHYAALAARLYERLDPMTTIVLAGGPAEQETNRMLSCHNPRLLDCGTNLSLEDFVALIASCDWILTPDSLAYHIACAVGVPALCLVGPTSPWELDDYGLHRVLYTDLQCIACYLQKCPFETTCMDRLDAETVSQYVPLGRGRLDSRPRHIAIPA